MPRGRSFYTRKGRAHLPLRPLLLLLLLVCPRCSLRESNESLLYRRQSLRRLLLAKSSSSSNQPNDERIGKQQQHEGQQRKLAALRLEMNKRNISAVLIPSQDPHFSEYVSKCFERRKFISNFTGSAGTCLVTKTSGCYGRMGGIFTSRARVGFRRGS